MNKSMLYNPAFSLIEMLMALLVVSLLLAALAPVMTRKLGDNVNISANNTTQSKGWRLYTYSSDCDKQEGKDNVCEFKDFTIPKGVYYLNLIMASGGGGGAGATSETKIQADPIQISGTTTKDGIKTIPITEYMTDVRVTLTGAGGSGAGGAGYVSSCPEGTQQFNGNSTTKAFCITRFNVGEKNNKIQQVNEAYVPALPASVSIANKTYWAANDTNAQNYCASGMSKVGQCCWYTTAANVNGSTADYPNCSMYTNYSSGGSYNSCSRTVCQWYAANLACSNFKYAPEGIGEVSWSLPKINTLNYLRDYASRSLLGSGGALLCDRNSNLNHFLCSPIANRCYGSSENTCNPQDIWSADTKDGSAYWFGLTDGKLGGAALGYITYAFSARCTLDKTKLFKSYSGGGGSSGSMLSNVDITSYIKQAGKEGTIELTAGKAPLGGSGANNKNISANNGIEGNISKILIKNKSGAVVYGLKVSGGKGGNAAISITVSGTAAAKTSAASSCQYTTNGTTWQNISCSKNSVAGNGGNTIWADSASAGTGAISPITSDTLGYGAGGAGGTSSYTYNDNISSASGSNGRGGLVKITYNNEFPGSGGGGGAGGNFVKISNLSLPADKECVIRIGGGGNYGSGQDGKDGGDTSIKCGNTKEYIVYGGKGGRKGTSGTSLSNPNPIGGLGGDIGKVSENIIQLGTLAEIKYGEGNFNKIQNEIKTKISGNLNIGGNGGKSGTDAIGGCGGLRPDNDPDCTNNGINATLGEYITPVYTNLAANNPDYGKTGAGGAGGGWSKDNNPKQGTGSSGQPGYLFLWWNQE